MPDDPSLLLVIHPEATARDSLLAVLRALPHKTELPVLVASEKGGEEVEQALAELDLKFARLTESQRLDSAKILVLGQAGEFFPPDKISVKPSDPLDLDTLMFSLIGLDLDALVVKLKGAGTSGQMGVHWLQARGVEVLQEECSDSSSTLAAEVRAFFSEGRERGLLAAIEEHIPEVCELLARSCELDFRHYRETTLARRVKRRMLKLGLDKPGAYITTLRENPEEGEALFQELLIGVTSFFRNPEVFDFLSRRVCESLVKRGKPLRLWVPACSTGEEVYSLAMLFDEARRKVGSEVPCSFFATDIDEQALQVARRGVYPLSIEKDVGRERLERYFTVSPEGYRVNPTLREACLFSTHNLLTDPPFSRLDLISCRNLLIYLGEHLQQKLMSVFHYALREEGFLVLGAAEDLSGHGELFDTVDSRLRVGQRRPGPSCPPPTLKPSHAANPPARPPVPSEPELYGVVERILLDEFSPRALVIDDRGTIVCTSGDIGRFFRFRNGPFRNNLLELARPGLRGPLAAAIREARRNRRRVERAAHIDETEMETALKLVVQPMPRVGADRELHLVVIDELERRSNVRLSENYNEDVNALELELTEAQQELQRTVRELELVNAELESRNQDLKSLNEEWRVANEELQSSQEEVQTINDELTRTNDNLRNLLNSTDISAIFLSAEGEVDFFTPAASQVYNLREGDVGRPLAHLTHQAKEMPAVPLDKGESQEIELELLDGRRFMRRTRPYLSADGEIRGTVLVFFDVSQLVQARAEAEASSRAKGEFLANMSHEIRTPMTAILGFCDVLAQHLNDRDNLACVNTIRRNADHLVNILNDILDLSKIEAGKLQVITCRFELTSVLSDVLSLMRVRAEEKGLELTVELENPLPHELDSDPTRVRQILLNLLGNAIKFTSEGKVTLKVALTAEDRLNFEVTDTGIGVSEEKLAELFQPFNQGDTSVTRRYGGTGLGLAICRRLASMLDGSIEARPNHPEKGSTFIFSLDLSAQALESLDDLSIDLDASEPVEQHPAVTTGQLRGSKVLVVDDRSEIRFLLQSYLEKAGASVDAASNGATALETISDGPYDVVLLDMQMPLMDGYETARQVRKRGIEVPIVALTASAMKGDREKCLEAGCSEYLTKPIQAPELLSTIEKLWRDRARPKKVLVVEDNAMAAMALKGQLSARGYRVFTAPTVKEAAAIFEEEAPEVAIIDMHLPDGDGNQLLHKLKEGSQADGVRFICHSGDGDAPAEEFDAVLLKPAAWEELEKAILQC